MDNLARPPDHWHFTWVDWYADPDTTTSINDDWPEPSLSRWQLSRLRVITTFAADDDPQARGYAVGIIRELLARAEARR